MARDFLGNPITHDIYGNPLKKDNQRVPVTSEQKKEILFRQKDKCAWPRCKVHFHSDGIPPHFDHIKRVDKGGKSLVANLQVLCPSHHQKKTHEENLKEIEKKRKSKPKTNQNYYYINPLTGKKIKLGFGIN